MIKIKWKYYWLIPFQEYWFLNSTDSLNKKQLSSNLSNIFIYQSNNNNLFKEYPKLNKKFKKVIFNTWVINLKQDTQEIFKNFSQTIRNEINKINRILNWENDYWYWNVIIWTDFFKSWDDNFQSMLIEAINFYNKEFAKYKLVPKLSYNIVKKYENNLLISRIRFNGYEGIYHIYLIDEEDWIARLEYSFSLINIDKNEKKLLWWLNNYLHLEDMKYLKNNWFKTYDFGWLFLWEPNWNKELEAQKYITNYKLKFKPEIIETYHYIKESIIYTTIKKIYLSIFK